MDIEREVELGGPIHSKGVLILSGYLAGRYAVETAINQRVEARLIEFARRARPLPADEPERAGHARG